MNAVAPARVVTPQFLLVLSATFAVFATFGMVILALPLYVRDVLAGSDVGVGVAIGAGSVGAIIAAAPAGRVADRRGRVAVMLGGAVVVTAGYAALALEPPLAAVAAIRVVAGAGEAAFVIASFTMVIDMAPPARRGEAMSLVTVGSYGGLAVGPLVANFLLDGDRFRLVFVAGTALSAAAIAVALVLRETRAADGDAPPRGFLPPRAALLPGFVLLLALIGFGGFNAFAALHAREIGFERPGIVFAVFGGVVVLVRLFGRTLPDRLGGRTAAAFACALVATGLLTIAATDGEAGFVIGTAIFASGQALAYPAIVLLAVARAAPAERSAAVGSVAAFVDVALGTGAFALGVVAELGGYSAVFVAGAVAAVAGLTLLTRLRAAPAPA